MVNEVETPPILIRWIVPVVKIGLVVVRTPIGEAGRRSCKGPKVGVAHRPATSCAEQHGRQQGDQATSPEEGQLA